MLGADLIVVKIFDLKDPSDFLPFESGTALVETSSGFLEAGPILWTAESLEKLGACFLEEASPVGFSLELRRRTGVLRRFLIISAMG